MGENDINSYPVDGYHVRPREEEEVWSCLEEGSLLAEERDVHLLWAHHQILGNDLFLANRFSVEGGEEVLPSNCHTVAEEDLWEHDYHGMAGHHLGEEAAGRIHLPGHLRSPLFSEEGRDCGPRSRPF